MSKIYSYVAGEFQTGSGDPVPLWNPTTEETCAEAFLGGFSASSVLQHARTEGLNSLASMGFADRAALLKKMAAVLHEHRDALIETSIVNGGTTRGGAKFDIDGASGTLAAYASMAKNWGASQHRVDGDSVELSRGARLLGKHSYVPRGGVAVLINAFNFPAWGFAEKAASALLAGMPVILKPATLTSLTAAKMAEILVESGVMPAGTFSMILGSVTELLDQLGPRDFVSFTGSQKTGGIVRSSESLIRNSVSVNVEADSLNAAVLGGDLTADADCYQLFLRDVFREMTEKTGQKCTATRRLIVPESMVETVATDLKERLQALKVGDPSLSDVRMGPLATAQQRDDVFAGMERLGQHLERLCGENRPSELLGVEGGKGYFAGASLFLSKDEKSLEEVHREEVFGPVACILPYDGSAEQAAELVCRGEGMLVSSLYSDSRDFLREAGFGIAPMCGRVVLVDSKAEGYSLPTGMVLPQLIHGGPGRAGGGEELGGERGVHHFMHRTAFQGSRGMVERILREE